MLKGMTLGVFMGAAGVSSASAGDVNENMPYRAYTKSSAGDTIEYGKGFVTMDDCKTAITDFQRQVLIVSDNYDENHQGMAAFLHAANQIKCYAIGQPV